MVREDGSSSPAQHTSEGVVLRRAWCETRDWPVAGSCRRQRSRLTRGGGVGSAVSHLLRPLQGQCLLWL